MDTQIKVLACAITSLLIAVIPPAVTSAHQQQTSPAARKFMVIGNERAEMEMARLHAFAEELNRDVNLRGYLVVYSGGRFSRGHILRKVHGYLDRLVNDRAVSPNRVEIIEAGEREVYATELWLVPNGGTFPIRLVAESVKAPLMFDRVFYGVGCEPEVSIDLYELDEGLKFWAKALAENSHANGWIIVNPKRRSSRGSALRVANRTKRMLMQNYKIGSQRLMIRVGEWRDECSNVEFWVVPAGMVPSRATPNNGMHPTANSVDLTRET
ncbi:MAG: hypothetical protein WKF74_04025 [Pyrinomonadaceae bacterium]